MTPHRYSKRLHTLSTVFNGFILVALFHILPTAPLSVTNTCILNGHLIDHHLSGTHVQSCNYVISI